MNRPPLDLAALAVGLAAVGFGVVLIVSPSLSAPFVQPILAVILVAAGTIGSRISALTSVAETDMASRGVA